MRELLSLSRMARRLGVTRCWLRNQADSGRVPCLRAGTRLLFNPVAVQEAPAAKATHLQPGGAEDVE
ncbi:hypothetical protein LCGC14_1761650 [marine sediment metagenome]|uniref:Helix-turn-helix domain-containing protein n=1 Tax=marine sediment metagenome TaxID=412755 RepID=A0A0F9K0G9_9ZZZZ